LVRGCRPGLQRRPQVANCGVATFAHIGAIVVWPQHVGCIVGQQGGTWVVESGNDGNAIRTRPRSLHGVIAIREP
jgi:hypothetical protein